MSSIGLASDNTNRFPSLPLMKISAYHKSLGDNVELLKNGQVARKDKIYISRTFNLDLKTVPQIDESYFYANEIEYGGSGYAVKVVDGKEVYDKRGTPKAKDGFVLLERYENDSDYIGVYRYYKYIKMID